MRTNVLIHNKLRITTVQEASEGLSDSLFSSGVRILEHCLNLTEAIDYIRSKVDARFNFYSLDAFKEAVLDKDDGARGLSWVGNKAPFGETTDKGLTPEMLTARRHWI